MAIVLDATDGMEKDITAAAKYQKYLTNLLVFFYLYIITIGYISLLPESAFWQGYESTILFTMMFSCLAFLVIYSVLLYQLAKALNCSPWLYLCLTLLGVGGIIAPIAFFILNGKANRFLKWNGVKVGFMGVSRKELRKYLEERKAASQE